MIISDKYLLNLLREVVSARASGRCEFPGCNITEADPHHAESKKNTAIRYDPDCCIYLCADHHTSGPISAHGTPEDFKHAVIVGKVRPYDWFDGVRWKANQYQKNDNDFKARCKDNLQRELRGMA